MWLIVTCVVEFFFTTQVSMPLSKLAWYYAFVFLIIEIFWGNCLGSEYNSRSIKWT
jgi:preprotein translocase subunit SecG